MKNSFSSLKTALTDRFGKLPKESRELLEVVQFRWKAIGLGIEKIILKEEKMICYFIADQKSPFYQSDDFLKIVQFIQKSQKRANEGN